MTKFEDDEALQTRRLNRNSRVREALLEFDRMRARALQKVDAVLRIQYPQGTEVRWGDKIEGPWHTGTVQEWDEVTVDGKVPVRNVIRGSKLEKVTAYQILWGGDND